MALTWVIDNESLQNLGPAGIIIDGDGTPASDDYVTDGYTIDPATFGLAIIRGLAILGVSGGGATAYLWQYDPATGKLQVFESGAEDADAAPFAEVAADTDLSALTVRVLVYGN